MAGPALPFKSQSQGEVGSWSRQLGKLEVSLGHRAAMLVDVLGSWSAAKIRAKSRG